MVYAGDLFMILLDFLIGLGHWAQAHPDVMVVLCGVLLLCGPMFWVVRVVSHRGKRW